MAHTKYYSGNNDFENNWMSKSLEALEKDYWPTLNDSESYLITTCHSLRKKQLKTLSIEELRLLIGQNIGLKYLVPIAIDVLREDIFVEGDYYEGDLLNSVLTSEVDYWQNHPENWKVVCSLVNREFNKMAEEANDHQIAKDLFNKFHKFQHII